MQHKDSPPLRPAAPRPFRHSAERPRPAAWWFLPAVSLGLAFWLGLRLIFAG